FTGSGATAATNKLAGLLGLRVSEPLEREYGFSKAIPADRRPAVLIGPYEHHSNVLPWLESVADVIEVGLDPSGHVDLGDLAAKLERVRERPLRIGAFSAASNVTGVITDVRGVARALHRGGAAACFDYAASGPYVPIDMHPAGDAEARMDAIFVSTHKFAGGPSGSGILVAHRDLFRTRTPERPGGGTVDYVGGLDPEHVDYTHRLDEREEGGTPAILADLRAGGAFLVKEMLGPERIVAHEIALGKRALDRLSRHPRLDLYGPRGVDRLAILPFNVKGLHHDFVSTLLDHLFGIQNRSGCSCAGPYGHRLLGIDAARSQAYRKQIAAGWLGLKPGWVRVSLPYYAAEEEIDFILEAIEFVADHGEAFLPLYRISWRSGAWRHVEHPALEAGPVEFTPAALREAAPPGPTWSDGELSGERTRYLREARELAAALEARAPVPLGGPARPDHAPLLWFRFVHADEA
ncbi:MAG TPA: aminotransferase class V-fold PLP-dependent enzyme, partial [Planctomycetota bacterium]|nr:aminotransferase class V-fold PLP-dependent enzyme [Planctomycetota bacterium]